MNTRPRAAFIERSWPSLNITNVAIANSTGETDLVARVPAAGILQDKDQLEPRDVRSVGEQASERRADDSECIADRAGEPGCGCRLWSGVWRWTCQGGIDRITGRQGADDAAINRIGTRTLFPLRLRPRKETRHQRGSQYRSGGVVLMLIDGVRLQDGGDGKHRRSPIFTRNLVQDTVLLSNAASRKHPATSTQESTSHQHNKQRELLPKIGGYFLLYTRTHSHLPFPPSPNHPSALHKN